MNDTEWKAFCNFRESFKAKVCEWNKRCENLVQLQRQAAAKQNTPEYQFENPIVYNTDLDKITQKDEIKLVVIGDNPGKDEQLTKNRRYLVGQAGKIAEGYFKKHPELGVDFRKNVIILNKTPVHSAKTNQLKIMIKLGGKEFESLLNETQIWMARETAALHKVLGSETGKTELWLVGYAELKGKGIFTLYRDVLVGEYGGGENSAWNNVYVFQHFSMNRFSIDLADYVKNVKNEIKSLQDNIHELGIIHRKEIFNC